MENKLTIELLAEERLLNESLQNDIEDLERKLIILKSRLSNSNDRITNYLNYLNNDEN